MENSFVYSSEYACDNITRRELRGLDGIVTRVHASKFSRDLLLPLGQRISTSGRIQRGVLKNVVERVEHTLRTEEGIIDVEVDSMTTSRMSANESYRFAFVAGLNSGEHWLEFMLNEARLTRKELAVHTTKADFRIHRHAISRYMQREQRPVREMYPQLTEALRASTLMAEAAAMDPRGHIALVIGDGLLLGRVRRYRWSDAPTQIERFVVRPKAVDHELVARPDEELNDYRLIVEMMTYIDHNSMVDSREALRDELRAFQDRRALELKMLFDATYFFSATVPADMANHVEQRLLDATTEAAALVEGDVWQHFAETAPPHA